MTSLITDLGRALRVARRPTDPTCLICKTDVRERDERVRVRGGALVHRRCATYRMRNWE